MSRRTYIHPFPARMAPELALGALEGVAEKSLIIDPMVGSGTVIKQASDLGFRARGYDLDPLAVLITKASVTPVDLDLVRSMAHSLLSRATKYRNGPKLAWIDGCSETKAFVNYWFGVKQRKALRKLASVVRNSGYNRTKPNEMDVLRVALSRIIITKEGGASLANDTAHSRPHRVRDTSDFEVFDAFEASVEKVIRYLDKNEPRGNATIRLGDAREMPWARRESAEMVVTSPPYLNAIDYLRGHRLSLVWLGHSISSLRETRSISIGAERASGFDRTQQVERVLSSFGALEGLPRKHLLTIERYAGDLVRLLAAIHRVLKPKAKAVIVIGDSHLHGIQVSNSSAIAAAGQLAGFSLFDQKIRELPRQGRYLPISLDAENALNKRMKTECVLTLEKIA